MRFSIKSLEAFRGAFGINQLASRMFTSAEDLSCCRSFGVTSKGALEVIDLVMYRTLRVRDGSAMTRMGNTENIVVELIKLKPMSARGIRC
jgi:hypothetical protein